MVLGKLAAPLSLVLLPIVAYAGMTQTTLHVSAQVINNCVVNVPSSVVLPAYDGTRVRWSADLQLRCTRSASPIVSLRANTTADGETRVLTSPNGNQLAYQVYSDPDYNLVWKAVTEPPADGVTLASYPIYWEIPSGQSVTSGTYISNLDVAVDPGNSVAKHLTIHVSSIVGRVATLKAAAQEVSRITGRKDLRQADRSAGQRTASVGEHHRR
jgi:spore coat protein U-like protein